MTPEASGLLGRLTEHRKLEEQLRWEGTFAQHFELLVKNPNLNQLSHARIHNMIQRAGTEKIDEETKKYKFFETEIFGLERPLQQIAEYFESAARRLEVRKRILLLMGPVGGGKSTIVALLKKGLERYSMTEEGAVYAIKKCPMQEDPLHLIPEPLRREVEREYGLYIEGDLCPHCSRMLQEEYQGKIEDVKIQRVVLSEKNRVGIGTFSPSDPKSQDISELTGSINLATIGQYGVESDPRAYRFDGELNIANRGLMEFIEMLKCDEKFLYGLLTLTQEQNIKTGRFAMIYADESIIAHTNENEYRAFIGDTKKEALHDRIILVKVPYNLRVSEETKIYEKLLRQSGLKLGKDREKGEVHVAPYTLKIAAIFAVLTRLAEGEIEEKDKAKKKATVKQKMQLYDGKTLEGFGPQDAKRFQEAAPREGMDGISPRYVINRLSSALVKDGSSCINSIDALRSLRDGLDQHTSITPEEKERYAKLITEARQEFDEVAKREVQRAFVYSFEESAETLFNSYIDNIEAYCNNTKLKDSVTGEDINPDEKLMRSIEEQIGISDNAKKTFREEVLIKMSSLARRGAKPDYASNERLREAIEKRLFVDLKDIVKITTTIKTPDAEQRKKIDEVIERLVGEHGYCHSCANELLKYVGALLNQ